MANSAKVDEAEQRKTRNEQAEFKNNDTNNGIHRDTITVPVLRPWLDGILGKKDVPPHKGMQYNLKVHSNVPSSRFLSFNAFPLPHVFCSYILHSTPLP